MQIQAFFKMKPPVTYSLAEREKSNNVFEFSSKPSSLILVTKNKNYLVMQFN